MTTDNAANNVAAFKGVRVPCVAHVLNLVIKKLKDIDCFEESIKEIKKISITASNVNLF